MAEFVFTANITDKNGNPLIGVEVEAIDIALFTTASRDPISHIVATATTDDSGTVTFTGLTPGFYYARPRLTRPDIRIQIMNPSGMGGGGKMCYAALVNPVAGIGTHTTIQAAITALGTGGGLIFICAGTYQENLTVAGDTDDLWLVGAGKGEVLIQGTAASPTISVEAVGTGGVTRFRLEHLTLDHTGAQTLLYFNSVAGGIPTQVDLLDLRFVSGTMAIDMSDNNGGTRFTLRDIVVESGVVAAGQLQVSDLTIANCKFYCSGVGLYVGGTSAATGIRIVNSELRGGSDCALRLRNTNDAQVTNCRLVATGIATLGLRITSANNDTTIGNCVFDIIDGIGIDVEFASGLLVIDGCSLACGTQDAAREGIMINGNVNEVIISDCHIKNFDSYGIKLETAVATNGQHFVIDGVIVINGEDTHSIYIGGWDYGTITGCVLAGTGGAGTTYGVYGTATTSNVVVIANTCEGHDDSTNLVHGTDSNIVAGNNPAAAGGVVFHDPVTLDANADALLSLSTQELGLDTQLANLVFAGAVSGGAAVPAFRSLVEADIPAAIMRDQEHTDIGDGSPHHAAITLGGGSDPALSLAGQELTLADVLTPTEHTAIGDAAPHHAAEAGESGTHTHGDLYYTEAEHGGVSPQGHHALVTLAADAQVLLNLSTQELGFVAQVKNLVFAGPATGGNADPTFRSLVDDDIPAAIARDSELHTRLHTMVNVLDHSATNWRMFYSDGSAHVIELALGADGTFLQSGGAGTLPEFTALVAGDIPDISATYATVVSFEDHSARHELAGADVISVAGLSGLLADDQHVLDAEVVAAIEAEATLAFQQATVISTTTGDLGLDPTGDLNILPNVGVLIGTDTITPDTLLHIWKASAGAFVPLAGTLLTLESDADAYITIASPTNTLRGILFGEPGANGEYRGWIRYFGSAVSPPDVIQFATANAERLRYSAGAFAFQEATTISTTAGDLTLSPTDNLLVTGAFIELDEIAKPANPAANKLRLYTKDKAGVSTLYYLQDDGTEVEVGAAGGNGATDHIIDADADTEVHTEKNADEDKVRVKTGGTERLVIDSTGAKFTDNVGIAGTAPSASYYMNISPTIIAAQHKMCLRINPSNPQFSGDGTFIALFGAPNAFGIAGGTHVLEGLNFTIGAAANNIACTFTAVTAIKVKPGAIVAGASGELTITYMRGAYLPSPELSEMSGGTLAITNYDCIDVEDAGDVDIATLVGLRIEDCTLATVANYILELGPTPYLRLEGSGSWTPAANETPLYLAEGATPTLRQVKAGDLGWHGSATQIKLLPQDIQVDHAYANPRVTNDAGHIDPNYAGDQYWSVAIPTGYKATHVCVYSETTDADGVDVFEGQISTGTTVSKLANATTNSEVAITNVTSSTTNYLVIRVNQAADDIYGGYVKIEWVDADRPLVF